MFQCTTLKYRSNAKTRYALIRIMPSSQLLLPSFTQKATVKTRRRMISFNQLIDQPNENVPAKNKTILSNGSKSMVNGLPRHQPRRINTGMTKRAIWILEPTATPILRSILSLMETVTAVTCSAAFPTMGRRMRPTHSCEIWPLAVRPSMELTRNSAVTATS